MARSIPDAMAACQDWASRLFEMMAEDRDHQLADYQMFAEAGAHFLWNIWQLNSSAVSAQWHGAGAASLVSFAALGVIVRSTFNRLEARMNLMDMIWPDRKQGEQSRDG